MAPSPDARPAAPAADEVPAGPRRGLLAAGWAKLSNAGPTLVVTFIVGLMLFIFSETSDRISRLEADMDARFAKLEENQQEIAVMLATLIAEFAAFEEDVDARFAAVDARFAVVDARLAKLEENQQAIIVTLARIDARLDSMDARFDGIDTRLDSIDTRLDSMDARFDGMPSE